ncbi:MAG: protein-glutamate methylesterase/protein-glutamine glutaminase, partial [bacterium]
VLVVDDSAVIRSMISDSISSTPGMVVVGRAADGREALQSLESAQPDVITLDVQMPNMDGIAALEALLARSPLPVVMVSSMTKNGAQVTLDALERGALDYVAKPDYGSRTREAILHELPEKIRSAAGTDVRRILKIRQDRKQRKREQPRPRRTGKHCSAAGGAEKLLADKCIAIGISTGGPPALSRLFESLRPPTPPIVIVQHMPANFTKPLAWRLDSLGALSVAEAGQGDVLKPNHALLAPGGKHLQVRRIGTQVKAHVRDGELVSGHKPSVDVLMESVVKVYGDRCLGIIMTGMGRDGANGCGAIRQRGGSVLGQDEGSSDVYGMNKVAYDEGHVDRQFPLDQAAATISREIQRRWLGTAAAR